MDDILKEIEALDKPEEYKQKLKKIVSDFSYHGYNVANSHVLNRIAGNLHNKRIKTFEEIIKTIQEGAQYKDPKENNYVRFNPGLAIIHHIEPFRIVNVIPIKTKKTYWENVDDR